MRLKVLPLLVLVLEEGKIDILAKENICHRQESNLRPWVFAPVLYQLSYKDFFFFFIQWPVARPATLVHQWLAESSSPRGYDLGKCHIEWISNLLARHSSGSEGSVGSEIGSVVVDSKDSGLSEQFSATWI